MFSWFKSIFKKKEPNIRICSMSELEDDDPMMAIVAMTAFNTGKVTIGEVKDGVLKVETFDKEKDDVKD